jgi:hypothetical protein
MIKQRNIGDFIAHLTINGTQTTTETEPGETAICIMPFAGYLTGIFARVGTAGITGSQTTDLLVNTAASAYSGFTSLVSTGTLLSYATTANAPTYNTANLNNNPILLLKGDIIQLKNTAVQSTPAVDQCVYLLFTRQRDSTAAEPLQTDTIDVPII